MCVRDVIVVLSSAFVWIYRLLFSLIRFGISSKYMDHVMSYKCNLFSTIFWYYVVFRFDFVCKTLPKLLSFIKKCELVSKKVRQKREDKTKHPGNTYKSNSIHIDSAAHKNQNPQTKTNQTERLPNTQSHIIQGKMNFWLVNIRYIVCVYTLCMGNFHVWKTRFPSFALHRFKIKANKQISMEYLMQIMTIKKKTIFPHISNLFTENSSSPWLHIHYSSSSLSPWRDGKKIQFDVSLIVPKKHEVERQIFNFCLK